MTERFLLAFLLVLALCIAAFFGGGAVGTAIRREHDRNTLALMCAKFGEDPRMCELAAAEFLK